MSCRRIALWLVVVSTSSAVWYCALLAILASACSVHRLDLAVDDPSVKAGIDGGRVDASVPPPRDAAPIDGSIPPGEAGTIPREGGVAARCGKGPCACDDGLDNDKDGLIDGLDPECTGALDQDEATFATGNESKAKSCRDCFWDEDQGTGSDACRYPTECLRGEAPKGNGSCGSCTVGQKCVDTCAARTPSGCDCFGCCEVWRSDGTKVSIELSDRCSLAKLDDTSACPRCMQSSQCRNPCGRCELCPGRTAKDLPEDCQARTPANVCDEGQDVCGVSADCSTTDQYCQQGCCFAVLL
jgi:hypothetical protein